MGRYLTPGHEYVDGQTISGPSLTEHVSEAVLKATAISEQVLKDPAALTDELLINDGGTLKKVTLQQLLNFISSSSALVPIGTVIDYAGADAPDGWLLCYGQEVSRETYSRLFTIIGTTYGAGNGTSSFLLPDLRGRVAAGKDDMGGTSASRLNTAGTGAVTIGGGIGNQTHALTVAELAYHTHAHNHSLYMYTVSNENGAYGLSTGGAFQGRPFITAGSAATGTTTDGTATGSNSGHNNIQPTIILNKIIRYQ